MSPRVSQRLVSITKSIPSGRSLLVPLCRSSCPQYQALRSSWRRQFSIRNQRIIYQNSISLTAAVAITVAIGASIGFAVGFSRAFNHPTPTESPIPASSQPPIDEMAVSAPPGRPGNLTPVQEEKLQELWQLALQVFGVAEAQTPQPASPTSPKGKTPILSKTSTGTEADSPAASEKKKKSRLSFLKKPKKEEEEYLSDTPTASISGTSTPSSGKSRISRVWGCGSQY